MINNINHLFNVFVIKFYYGWLTYICVVFLHGFSQKADFIEANCLPASIKCFILYTVATEKCQSMHAVYLAAS